MSTQSRPYYTCFKRDFEVRFRDETSVFCRTVSITHIPSGIRIARMIPLPEIMESTVDVVSIAEEKMLSDLIHSTVFLDWVKKYLRTDDPVKVFYNKKDYYNPLSWGAFAFVEPHGLKEAVKEIRNARNSSLPENR